MSARARAPPRVRERPGPCGTAAVQLAKHFGAHVTAVCNTKMSSSCAPPGADVVIDYLQEDFTKNGKNPARSSWMQWESIFLRCRGYSRRKTSSRPTAYATPRPRACGQMESAAGGRSTIPKLSKKDVLLVKELIEGGHTGRSSIGPYRFEEVVEATRYVETWQKTGNVVLTVNGGHA